MASLTSSAQRLMVNNSGLEVGLQYGLERANVVSDTGKREGLGDRLWRYGYTTGLAVKINTNINLAFETGVLFSFKGFRKLTTGEEFLWEYSYVEIPLGITYNIHIDEMQLSPSIMLIPSYLNSFSGNTYTDGGKATSVNPQADISFQDRMMLGSKAKINFSIPITSRLRFNLAPQMYYSLWQPESSVFNQQNTYHFFSYGVDISLMFLLGKFVPTF